MEISIMDYRDVKIYFGKNEELANAIIERLKELNWDCEDIESRSYVKKDYDYIRLDSDGIPYYCDSENAKTTITLPTLYIDKDKYAYKEESDDKIHINNITFYVDEDNLHIDMQKDDWLLFYPMDEIKRVVDILIDVDELQSVKIEVGCKKFDGTDLKMLRDFLNAHLN
jgi:hypothetical protein